MPVTDEELLINDICKECTFVSYMALPFLCVSVHILSESA
jgi:hypothetical protein